jgi:hypothetical protein
MIDHAVSAITLISLFVLGPAFGRAILLRWDNRGARSQAAQHVALGVATMLAISAMVGVYGAVWSARPSAIAWYGWLSTDIPISGNVDVTGSVSADISEPLRVKVEP